MRVITGTLGGRTLRHPADRSFRPTTDRVKESIFNILAHRFALDGARVPDLFAGSGALGIEALSRGAEHAVFVESSRDSLLVLRANIAALGIEAQCSIVEGRAEDFARRSGEHCDVILADPPYAFDGREDLIETVMSADLLSPAGVLVFEHAADVVIQSRSSWSVTDRREFGTTAVSFIRHSGANEAS
jgi:16S rRNA (guanine966-N2)-methyltransferase